MRHLAFVLLSTLLLCAATPAPTSQPEHLPGRYDIKNENGKVIGEIAISQPVWPIPFYVGRVFVNGEEIESEELAIGPRPGGGWQWENVQGNQGEMDLQSNGEYRSEVTTGPNAGTVRYLDPK